MPVVGQFLAQLSEAKDRIKQSRLTESLILHHDEADGIVSGSLAKMALERLGLKTRLICIDKLYPEIVSDVESAERKIIVYADIGSAHVDFLSQANKSDNIILTLDHHDTVRISHPNVYNLNPELDGFPGETDASSSTVAYLFAKIIDNQLVSQAGLAVIGSVEVPGEAQSLNKIAKNDAIESHSLEITKAGRTIVRIGETEISPVQASSMLNLLGSVGYYRNGPDLGIDACVHGFGREVRKVALGFGDERKEANRKMMSTLVRKGLSEKKAVQWFHAGDNYKGMSGKVVGSFCSYLRYQRFISSDMYLLGMMSVEPEIPGWGVLRSNLVKVSVRVPEELAVLIQRGEKPSASVLLTQACKYVGGFGDGHSVAASGVIPAGAEERFLDEFDRLARSQEN